MMLRLGINYRKKKKKLLKTVTWRLNNTFLNNKQDTEEIKKELENIPRNKWRQKHDDPKPLGCNKSSSKTDIYSKTILPQETRITSNRQPTFTFKTTRKNKNKNKKIQSL